MSRLIDSLREPMLDSLDVDGDARINLHREILSNKKMLKLVFAEIHSELHRLAEDNFDVEGIELELGAGVAPMKDTFPEVLATDIVKADHLDRVLDAQNMDLESDSVRVFYGQNCFHHFPEPVKFFEELDRVLKPGGGAIILEPYFGPFAGFVYKRLFSTEGFDKDYPDWETPITGPMNGANQALSYLVFHRDREKFTRMFPNLEIVEEKILKNYLKYLLSGGLNFRQLIPNALTGVVSAIETIASPLKPMFGLHHITVLRKARN
jgi:SAM-dependent methyltransferase